MAGPSPGELVTRKKPPSIATPNGPTVVVKLMSLAAARAQLEPSPREPPLPVRRLIVKECTETVRIGQIDSNRQLHPRVGLKFHQGATRHIDKIGQPWQPETLEIDQYRSLHMCGSNVE